MALFTELDAQIGSLRASIGEGSSADLPAVVRGLTGADILSVLEKTTAAIRLLETVRICAAGVAAELSARESGHSGLAQSRGHRSPVALVQHVLGTTRAEAVQHVRLGEVLLGAWAGGHLLGGMADDGPAEGEPIVARAWHAPLGEALLDGRLTRNQHDAIRRGLGEPPSGEDADAAVESAMADAWSCAADQLIGEAASLPVEELAAAARQVRDALDPEGALRRFDERYENRSFRMWRDADGVQRAHISFDDEMAAWVQTIIASAMRPRRGGPRFVDSEEQRRAQELIDDPRTNDQLTYDLLMDTLRAGALADPAAVFGTRQAGVRIVVTQAALVTDGDGRANGIAHVEDGGDTLPAWVAERAVCETGSRDCMVDTAGRPLDVGREQRLFTPKQRIALALRDGGCRWSGCTAPASYCEAHHIDHFAADEGRTDVDRGVLLCRFHHMQLHNKGWRIRREGHGEFLLHPPGEGGTGSGLPVVLRSRSPLRWKGIGPPQVA